MAVTFAEYQRRCLEMSPGISPPRSSAVFEAGGFDSPTADWLVGGKL